jgi:site-specific DNA-methyltransferase (adenine-specific)
MTPYYAEDGIRIYHGDCREVVPALVPADVVVTDPPYGIQDSPLRTVGPSGMRVGMRAGRVNTWHPSSAWDLEFDFEWPRLIGAAADIVAWFGHWRKRDVIGAAMGLPLRAEIIWAKDMHTGPPGGLVAMRDERIWLFSRKPLTGRPFDTSVWDEPVIPTWAHKFHKNEKPVKLLTRLLRLVSDPHQTVLDPFMGSGTTLRAAKDLQRQAIGIDSDERYCEIAARRLAQGVLPLEASA